MNINFEWNGTKNITNTKKHGVSFHEAKSVFLDENAIYISDPDHSDEEDRYIILGISESSHLLVVVYCMRDNEETIRIISARIATKQEERQYFQR